MAKLIFSRLGAGLKRSLVPKDEELVTSLVIKEAVKNVRKLALVFHRLFLFGTLHWYPTKENFLTVYF